MYFSVLLRCKSFKLSNVTERKSVNPYNAGTEYEKPLPPAKSLFAVGCSFSNSYPEIPKMTKDRSNKSVRGGNALSAFQWN